VIHSFWVPELQGKMDLNPGETNVTWIQADRPGVYRGLCAEFCGLQHSNMKFLVIAQEPEEFDAWVEREQQPAAPPADNTALRGQQVFLGAACVYCHHSRHERIGEPRPGPDALCEPSNTGRGHRRE
jgi:cytochrome c oxidase subunit II